MSTRAPSVEDDLDLYDIPEICRRADCGRTFIYQEIAAGHLRAVKLGRLTRIPAADYRAWIGSMPRLGHSDADPIGASPTRRPADGANGSPGRAAPQEPREAGDGSGGGTAAWAHGPRSLRSRK